MYSYLLPQPIYIASSCTVRDFMWAHVTESGLFRAEFIARQCAFIGWATPVTSQTVEVLYFTTVCDSKKDVMIENTGES